MKEELAVPGTFLGFEEEFVAGNHAFEAADGGVYSTGTGVKRLDPQNHEASVEASTRNVRILRPGDIVVGVVSAVKSNMIHIDIKEAEKNNETATVHNGAGFLFVRNISTAFVKSTDEMFRIGDLVKARVTLVESYGIELETISPELGVIKAFGSRSRKPLILIGGNLRDPSTGETESRKISTDYLLR